MDAYRSACDWLSGHVFETGDLNQASLNDAHYAEIRQRFGLKSQMAQSVMKTVVARYKSARSNGHAWSRVEFKRPEYDLVWNRDYSLTRDRFSVNTLDGRIKLDYARKGMRRYFNGTWRFGTAKLVHNLPVPSNARVQGRVDRTEGDRRRPETHLPDLPDMRAHREGEPGQEATHVPMQELPVPVERRPGRRDEPAPKRHRTHRCRCHGSMTPVAGARSTVPMFRHTKVGGARAPSALPGRNERNCTLRG